MYYPVTELEYIVASTPVEILATVQLGVKHVKFNICYRSQIEDCELCHGHGSNYIVGHSIIKSMPQAWSQGPKCRYTGRLS